PIVDKVVETSSRLVDIRWFAEDRADRIGLWAVPVPIENRREPWHHITHDEDVHVHEVAGRAAGKVFVSDVPTPHHGYCAVRDEELVMHPVVEPSEFAQRRGESARDTVARTAKWIEEPHLDVGERRQPAKHRVSAYGVQIVDQQPDADAAHRRVAQ